eukprot:1369219-Pyramimonas_sp.AAC.1
MVHRRTLTGSAPPQPNPYWRARSQRTYFLRGQPGASAATSRKLPPGEKRNRCGTAAKEGRHPDLGPLLQARERNSSRVSPRRLGLSDARIRRARLRLQSQVR